MKVLVLGAGRMGHGAVFDLIRNSPDVEQVTVADFDLAKAEAALIAANKKMQALLDANPLKQPLGFADVMVG